jgi:hypothetical protein
MEHAPMGLVILIVPAIQDIRELYVRIKSITALPGPADQVSVYMEHASTGLVSSIVPALLDTAEHCAKHK